MASSKSLWRNADFLKLWIGQAVSEVGSRITREGIPYTAVLVLHAHASQMGLLNSLGGLSVLIFGLTAGVSVDRMARRPILIAADLGRAVLLCSVPLAAAWHLLSMAQLYAVAAIAGILTVFFDVAYQSYLPLLVDKESLLEGNAKLMLTATGAEILGPGITGILVQLITAPMAMLFDAASFLFSACMVFLIRTRHVAPAQPPMRQHVWRESIAGLHFIAGNPVLKALALRSTCASFFYGFLGTLYILYAVQVLRISPGALGITIALGGVSATLGSMLAARVTAFLGIGPSFIVTGMMHAAAASLIPLAHGTPIQAMLFLMASQLLGDGAYTVYYIAEISLRQTIVPPELLGRVNAAMQLASRGVVPIGAVVSGFLTEGIGARPVLAIAAGGIFLSTVFLLVRPVRSLRML